MADISDITAYIAQQAAAAVYPGGSLQPSVSGAPCRIFEGWPIGDQLEKDIAAGKSNVSIFPPPGQGLEVFQVLDNVYTIATPTYGMAITVAGTLITVAGQPHPGEYMTLVVDANTVFSRTGANTAALLAALLTDLQAGGYPSASATATTLTVPYGHSLVVRQGGPGVQGKVTHRQKQTVMVTVWSPNERVRAVLAAAIDVLIKEKITVSMPDTSMAAIRYNRTVVNDDQQSTGIYRRDLFYDVEYATLQTFPAYVVTSVNTTIASLNGPVQATALT
jgi:hypothetical protein